MARRRRISFSVLIAAATLVACDGVLPKYEFKLTRLAADGREFRDGERQGSQAWACTRDDKTMLTWEVKTADAGLHAGTSTYTWYGRDEFSNRDTEGKRDGGTCTGSRCDTEAFVAAVNAEKLCGFTDWRLPSTEDASTLIDASVRYPGPTLPAGFFPNAQSGKAGYWTGTEFDKRPSGAWAWRLDHGVDFAGEKDQPRYVMLVRGKNVTQK
jgi:hypothetical protein